MEFCNGQIGVVHMVPDYNGTVYDDLNLPLLLKCDGSILEVAEFSQLAERCRTCGVSMRDEVEASLDLFCHILLKLYGCGRVLRGELGRHDRSLYIPELTGDVDPVWEGETLQFYAEQQRGDDSILSLVVVHAGAVTGNVDVKILGER